MSLKLNWDLEFRDERNAYISEYIERYGPEAFTQDDLDMMAKYILWAKDRTTGLNGRQEGLDLPTRFKTWENEEIQSLDALLESPSFSESLIKGPSDPVYKTPKLKFKRSLARETSTPFLKPYLEDLWTQIDETELLVTLYELEHGRRTLPIRAQLAQKFDAAALEAFRKRAISLKQYDYLKKKHELVELRRLQYVYKDSYSPSVYTQPSFQVRSVELPSFGNNIYVRPAGLKYADPLSQKLFREDRYPEPADFSEADLAALSKLLWTENTSNYREFDFCNEAHLKELIALYDDLSSEDFNFDSTLPFFLNTFNVYISLAHLKDFQRDILNYKIKHLSNEKIQHEIERKYGKKYSLNYISTLYRKTILPEVARTARKHREVLENLFYPENFKTCLDCKRTFLRDDDNFMKKSKVKDGYSPRCKRCEKILRDKRRAKNGTIKN